jgi:uncharacterized protein
MTRSSCDPAGPWPGRGVCGLLIDTREQANESPSVRGGRRRGPGLALLQALLMLMCMVGTVHAQASSCRPAERAGLAGAYRTQDNAVISVLPEREEGRYRITYFDSGRSHQLYPAGQAEFQSSDDLNSETPVAYRYRFRGARDAAASRLSVRGPSRPALEARRVPLVEREASIRSGDVVLHGRLTLPPGRGQRFKTVVHVHGSDPLPSVGYEWLPHLLASQGIATLVFDKRGTGCSTGQYVQHFGVLAGDVVAAVDWLARQPDVDATQIGLAGFSQGGWVAPLAATREPRIKFVAVGFGLATSLADEDLEEAPLKLLEQGVSPESVEEFKALNGELHQLARAGFQDWRRFEQALTLAKTRPWFDAAARQASWLGLTVQMGLEKAKEVAPQMFQNFFQPFYEPLPTLEAVGVPMLWLMGGKDIEAPPHRTLQILSRLREKGKPISVVVFPEADHGIQDFVIKDRARVRTQYSEGYFRTLLAWVLKPA